MWKIFSSLTRPLVWCQVIFQSQRSPRTSQTRPLMWSPLSFKSQSSQSQSQRMKTWKMVSKQTRPLVWSQLIFQSQKKLAQAQSQSQSLRQTERHCQICPRKSSHGQHGNPHWMCKTCQQTALLG
jgi:hypothetical protein